MCTPSYLCLQFQAQSNGITTFRFPPAQRLLISTILVTPVFYAYAATKLSPPSFFPSLFKVADEWLRVYVSDQTWARAFYITSAIHVVEAGYTATLVKKYVTSPIVGAIYILLTFFFGAPMWRDLKLRGAKLNKSQ
ncbi:hypothetical protein DL96DRAFT_1556423 [Flagelloscypha sp. PMI_526]|nr:hypothetical protein DL96DRAFT_1556423 [Flagelloscypha sp. PMI_526]